MNRRSALRRLGGLALGALASTSALVPRGGPVATATVRDALGWLAVIGQRGDVLIRISPRFAVEHPVEVAHLILHGRLP